MKLSHDEILKIEKFVANLDADYKLLKNFIQYLKLTEQEQKIVDYGLELLKNKIKQMKKSESVDKIDEIIKVKKILKKEEN